MTRINLGKDWKVRSELDIRMTNRSTENLEDHTGNLLNLKGYYHIPTGNVNKMTEGLITDWIFAGAGKRRSLQSYSLPGEQFFLREITSFLSLIYLSDKNRTCVDIWFKRSSVP